MRKSYVGALTDFQHFSSSAPLVLGFGVADDMGDRGAFQSER